MSAQPIPIPEDIIELRRSAAVYLAGQGLGIIHVPSGGKAPSGIAWQRRATTDADAIRGMLSTEDDGYGVFPPEGSGLLIADEDVPGALDELVAAVPPTLTVRTGGGGRHVYLRLADPAEEARVPRSWAGGQVRLAGSGHVVGPWCRHATGRLYLAEGETRQVATVSVEAILAHLPRVIRPANGVDPGFRVAEPGRHDFLLARARWLRGHGLAGDPLRDMLRRLNAEHCDPPKPEAEVDLITQWVMENIGDDAPEPRLVDGANPAAFVEPEDRSTATPSKLAEVEYVEDMIRPGRILVVAAEEGTGKSYLMDAEAGLRLATAGGSVAGTWPVRRSARVVYLSEQHPDDDFAREDQTMASLGITRDSLAGRYYRLGIGEAVGGQPPLLVTGWPEWFAGWLDRAGVDVAIFDTITLSAPVESWGEKILGLFANLRAMIAARPSLALVLVVHFKKPLGRGGGDRELSDVLGWYGRLCDVVLLMSREGTERVRLSLRKRVRVERRVVATKRDGLLVDSFDLADAGKAGPRVPLEAVLAAVAANPGSTYAELGAAVGVSDRTIRNYLTGPIAAGTVRVERVSGGPARVYPCPTTPESPESPEIERVSDPLSGVEGGSGRGVGNVGNNPVGVSDPLSDLPPGTPRRPVLNLALAWDNVDRGDTNVPS